jgi:crossover junction endodeoxyribonuclease RuvC
VTIGIDYALVNLGLCTYQNGEFDGRLLHEAKLRDAARLHQTRKWILAQLDEIKPDLVAIEAYSYGSINRAFSLGEVGGVIREAVFSLGTPMIFVPPSSLKLFITGHGLAKKKSVIRALVERYGYATSDDNIADAAALARLAYVFLTNTSKYRSELEVVKKLRESETPKPPVHRRKWKTV